MSEYVIRFLAGGAVVSAFAMLTVGTSLGNARFINRSNGTS